MKKIFYYLLILLGFVFAFINVDKINTLAVTNIENTFGTYPVAMDIENYQTYNLLDLPIVNNVTSNCGITANVEEHNTINVTGVATCNGQGPILVNNLNLVLQPGIYTFAALNINFIDNGYGGTIYLGTNQWDTSFSLTVSNGLESKLYNTVVINENLLINYLRFYTQGGPFFNSTFQLMLYKGEYDIDKTYADNFYFGYELDIVYNGINKYSIPTEVKLNGNTCFNMTNTAAIVPGENVYMRANVCFIPFKINNFGYISLDEININTTFNSSGLVFSNESGYILRPILKGYYKGEYVENIIYLKNSYNVNSFYFNGFNVKVGGNNDANINTIAIRPYENINPGNNLFPISTEITSYNFISEYISNVIFTNQININEFLNVQFALTFGNYTNVTDINKLTYTISLSGINSIIRNEIGTNSPIPNNPNTIDRYNKCSAWYDIPCQLGNAVTYVIYEAPVISPVLTFIVSFITMFSSLVSFVDLFKSFGIVFVCFIIYMFIELLHKYSK